MSMPARSVYYLAQAELAIAHVKEKLPLGASNRGRGWRKAVTRVNEARLDARDLIAQGAKNPGKMIADTAVVQGAGNCGEQVRVAFEYLKSLGVSPLEIFSYEVGVADHSWLVIGRPAGTETRWIEDSWGDAVICDPWKGFCFVACENDRALGSARFAVIRRWVRRGPREI